MVGDKVWQLGPRVIYHNATFKSILTYLFRARIARGRQVFIQANVPGHVVDLGVVLSHGQKQMEPRVGSPGQKELGFTLQLYELPV